MLVHPTLPYKVQLDLHCVVSQLSAVHALCCMLQLLASRPVRQQLQMDFSTWHVINGHKVGGLPANLDRAWASLQFQKQRAGWPSCVNLSVFTAVYHSWTQESTPLCLLQCCSEIIPINCHNMNMNWTLNTTVWCNISPMSLFLV